MIISSKMKIIKILKIHQKEYYQSENALNYNDEIQNIILNILDDDNICELNRDISKILSIDNKFFVMYLLSLWIIY